MAYYSSNYYELDPVYHNQNLYYGSYNSQPLITYPDQYNQYNYHPTSYYGYDYDSAASDQSIISYSASTFSEPKYIEQELNNFTISYSVAGFNEPDFLEYDPTPYGGGYDITQQYGKPLPPSKEICYPLSSGSTNGSTQPPPLIKEEKAVDFPAKSSEEGKLTTIHEEDESQASDGSETENDEPSESENDESGDEFPVKSSEENTIKEDGNYEPEKAVSQTPPGYYGLGSMDFCGSFYDYWPCLNRDSKKKEVNDFQQEGNNNTVGYSNQWEGAADYLFGSSYPYSERRDAAGSFESVIYGYERHYQQESLKFEQPVYVEDYSWESEYTLN